ncbi:hypothetical protein HJFPF1_08922 [Paramyrothecium foliicola]|nr:hypothetical protein HJFPF1_08922 [Paramyrothecium foliicola]
MSWSTLAPELRAHILEATLPLTAHEAETEKGLGALASICKEWQGFYERKLFHRLVIFQSCIADFARIVQGQRRTFVKHIWLQVQLPEYETNGPYRESNETKEEVELNNQVLTAALWNLLDVLSSWSRDDPTNVIQPKLTLELSVLSPSDTAIYSFIHCPGINVYPDSYSEGCTMKQFDDQLTRHMQDHQSNHERKFIAWLAQIMTGIFLQRHILFSKTPATPLQLDFDGLGLEDQGDFPQTCPVVTDFLIRRQHERQIHPNVLLPLLRKLPSLENLRLEPWNSIDDSTTPDLPDYANALSRYFQEADSLKVLSIFESRGESLSPDRVDFGWTILGFVFARKSHALTHMSIACATDALCFLCWTKTHSEAKLRSLPDDIGELLTAEDSQHWSDMDSDGKSVRIQRFLGGLEQTDPMDDLRSGVEWANLESLALTSILLNPYLEMKMMNLLLQIAAEAAERMPKLKIMELWNQDENLACVFRYRREGPFGQPSIHLASTWEHSFSEQVLDAWKRVAEVHVEHGILQVGMKVLPADKYGKYGAIVGLLELRDLVLHPLSACEMYWGTFKTN